LDLGSGATGIDLRAIWHLALRRRWVIIVTAVTLFSAVALNTLRQPRIYGASTSVVIDATPPRILDGQVADVADPGPAGYWYTKEFTETQTSIIMSRAVSQRAVEKLGLDHDPAFLGVGSIADPKAREAAMRSADAAGLLQSRLAVLPVKDTRIITVRVEDLDPKRAALLANEVAEAYINENLALRLRISESANRWLEDRLAELEQRTKQSEIAVYDFKKDADMLTTSLVDTRSALCGGARTPQRIQRGQMFWRRRRAPARSSPSSRAFFRRRPSARRSRSAICPTTPSSRPACKRWTRPERI
jgi:uncharacterized protein involved in exopolysaccharide biosynthesis